MRSFHAALAIVAFCLLALASTTAQAQEKTTFRKAPAFKASTWVQGKATTLNDKNTIYVVELWATWCGPCRTSLPSLAALQTKHHKVLKTVALTDDDLNAVKRYVKATSAMAPLAVAVDSAVYNNWSKTFDVKGIPSAFLVKGGEVLWSGHPASMEPILERILAGRWTPESEASMRAYAQKSESYITYWRQGGTLTAKAKLEGEALLPEATDNPNAANSVAWSLLTETPAKERPLSIALALAEQANTGSKGENFAILDTYARALYLTGDKAKAIAMQTKSHALCKKEPGANCGELAEILSIYKQGGTLP